MGGGNTGGSRNCEDGRSSGGESRRERRTRGWR